ncbi:MAG: hypothetical protein JWR26_2101 [Pedosphaera sp.]|nr:hypothetical protein [Pedosphaera sp.]
MVRSSGLCIIGTGRFSWGWEKKILHEGTEKTEWGGGASDSVRDWSRVDCGEGRGLRTMFVIVRR